MIVAISILLHMHLISVRLILVGQAYRPHHWQHRLCQRNKFHIVYYVLVQ